MLFSWFFPPKFFDVFIIPYIIQNVKAQKYGNKHKFHIKFYDFQIKSKRLFHHFTCAKFFTLAL